MIWKLGRVSWRQSLDKRGGSRYGWGMTTNEQDAEIAATAPCDRCGQTLNLTGNTWPHVNGLLLCNPKESDLRGPLDADAAVTYCSRCGASWTAPVGRCPECCCGPGEGCSSPDCTGTPAAGVGAPEPVDDIATESRSSGRRDGHPGNGPVQAQAAVVIRRHLMVPYSDGKGGHLFRGATPEELAAALGEADLLIPSSTCRECNSAPAVCRASRIKCCPDCTHTKADLNGGSDD